MTIAIAIVSRSGAVVASDGRVFNNDKLKSDDSDKTFQIFDGRILGVTSGLQGFCGKKIGEHISEILESKQTGKIRLDRLVEELTAPFIERLENIKQDEIGFMHRKVDIILAARQLIYGTRFKPVDDRISCDGWNKYQNFALCGDDKAVKAARPVIEVQMKQLPGMRREGLISLAERAIGRGIANSGPYKYNKCFLACGGKTYHKYV